MSFGHEMNLFFEVFQIFFLIIRKIIIYITFNFFLLGAFSGFPVSDSAKFQNTTNAEQSLECIPCTSSSLPLVEASFCGTLMYLQLH